MGHLRFALQAIEKRGPVIVYKSTYYDQGAAISAIMALHTGGSIDADLTFCRGAMWKKVLNPPRLNFDVCLRPERKYDNLFNIDRHLVKADCRELPLPDGCLKSVMFDPPFIAGKARSDGIMNRLYGGFDSHEEMLRFYRESLAEIKRVLKTFGVLVFKCQDYVNGRTPLFTHVDIFELARAARFRPVDLFILLATNRPIRQMDNQVHARKFHCYFWIFKKRGKR